MKSLRPLDVIRPGDLVLSLHGVPASIVGADWHCVGRSAGKWRLDCWFWRPLEPHVWN